jgi:hypothetical protein
MKVLSAAVLVLVLSASSGAAFAGSILDCVNREGMKSAPSTDKVTIVFRNSSAAIRELDWIDFNGNPIHYATIAPKGKVTQETFKFHLWKITDAAGGCVMLYVPGNDETVRIP